METASVGERRDSERDTTEQGATVSNDRAYAVNISVVSKRQALTGSLHPRVPSGHNGDSAIKLYLCEIGQVKRLTPQEETKVVARTKRGDRRARERLIKANLRRVVEISREYENIGLPLLDLISEGNIGLMKAVERFEPTKGNRFSTFSTWWIRQSIRRALANQSKAVPQQLDKGSQAGLLQFPVRGNTTFRSRPSVRVFAGCSRRHSGL